MDRTVRSHMIFFFEKIALYIYLNEIKGGETREGIAETLRHLHGKVSKFGLLRARE